MPVKDEVTDTNLTIDDWKNIANYLYQLLDDIDTTGDVAKADDKLYRRLVEQIHSKKSKVVAGCDGYTVIFKALENMEDLKGSYPDTEEGYSLMSKNSTDIKVIANEAIEKLKNVSTEEFESKCNELGHTPIRKEEE